MGNVASGATPAPLGGTPEQYVQELTALASGRCEVKGNTRQEREREQRGPQEREGRETADRARERERESRETADRACKRERSRESMRERERDGQWKMRSEREHKARERETDKRDSTERARQTSERQR